MLTGKPCGNVRLTLGHHPNDDAALDESGETSLKVEAGRLAKCDVSSLAGLGEREARILLVRVLEICHFEGE